MLRILRYEERSWSHDIISTSRLLAANFAVRPLFIFFVKVELIKNDEATFKGAGFDGTSLSDEQKENMQEMVQDIFNDFKSGVLGSRPQISDDSMRGQVFLGRKAKQKGLVDMNGSYSDALQLLQAEINR